MRKFTGELCPVCNDRFKDNEDIVVCPDCGTPCHSACYGESGECVNAYRHAEDFAWKSRLDGLITALEEREKMIAVYEREEEKESEEELNRRDIYGVSKNELSCFMKIPVGSYEYKLKILNRRKMSPNFLAGLLSPFYQFYKGMRLFGTLLLIPSLLMSTPYILGIAGFMHAAEKILAYIQNLPENAYVMLTLVLNLLNLAEIILIIMFNDFIYLYFAAGKIKKIRKRFPNEGKEYYRELTARGAVGIGRMFAEMLCITLAFMIVICFAALTLIGQG